MLDVLRGLTEEQRITFFGLYVGLRDEIDPVTWRTLVIKSRTIFGSCEDPDNVFAEVDKEILATYSAALLDETLLKRLTPEFVADVSGDEPEKAPENLDVLLLNGRHFPEPLLFSITKYLEEHDKKIAELNDVGRYSDDETRILTPKMRREVKSVLVVASTQAQRGGSYETLSKVCRVVRAQGMADKIKELVVLFPMAGGSRGHKDGQNFGIEVTEATANAKLLALNMRDIVNRVKEEFGHIIRVKFASVDIHNDDSFRKVLEENDFEFVNIDPSSILATHLVNDLEQDNCMSHEVESIIDRFISCDAGSEARTQTYVTEFLRESLRLDLTMKEAEIVYIHKKRKTAGVVGRVWISRVERWAINGDGSICKFKVIKPSMKKPNNNLCRAHYRDDMIDSGGTLKLDDEKIRRYYSNIRRRDVAATHAVLSKGMSILNKLGMNKYYFTNSLAPDGLRRRKDTEIVDVAESVVQDLYGSHDCGGVVKLE